MQDLFFEGHGEPHSFKLVECKNKLFLWDKVVFRSANSHYLMRQRLLTF